MGHVIVTPHFFGNRSTKSIRPMGGGLGALCMLMALAVTMVTILPVGHCRVLIVNEVSTQ
jgi:hypothetical protein